MTDQRVNRRKFVRDTSAGVASLAAGVSVNVEARADSGKTTKHLALAGGRSLCKVGERTRWPIWDEREERALLDVLHSNRWHDAFVRTDSSDHPCEMFAQEFAEYQDAKYGLCVNSGTMGQFVLLKAAGVGPGDEVIVPAANFIGTFSAFLWTGAMPVLVDVDPWSACMTASGVEQAITDKTKAIVLVHLHGYMGDVDAIVDLAARHGIRVIEDCAHTHGAKWKGRGTGSLGDAGCFSFFQNKPMGAGEGGLITTNDEELFGKAYSIINVGRFHHADTRREPVLGASFRMTQFQAALCRAQFSRLPEQTQRIQANAERLSDRLETIPGIAPCRQDKRITTSSYAFYMYRYDEDVFGLPRRLFQMALARERAPCAKGDPWSCPVYRNQGFVVDPSEYRCKDQPPGTPIADLPAMFPGAEDYNRKTGLIGHPWLLCKTREAMDEFGDAIEKIAKYKHEILHMKMPEEG